MTKNEIPPWASGSGEILKHGIALLKEDTDINRRLAMINIDNAVELMMKTYLGLPKRITGLKITRKESQYFSESFPNLLNALEKHASDKVENIDLGAIEWFHRLRNELYHQGNGLTVERDKVEVYAELANVMFVNLFGFRLIDPKEVGKEILGNFMDVWFTFEAAIMNLLLTFGERPRNLIDAISLLHNEGLISRSEMAEIHHLRTIRNEIVHGQADYNSVLNSTMVDRLKELTTKMSQTNE
jgi:DNA-binding MltR family transcriptional regulator